MSPHSSRVSKQSRVYTGQPLAPGTEFSLEAEAGHYLTRVLRLRVGDTLVLYNGDGNDYAAELLSARRDQVRVRVIARLPAVAESPLDLTLVQAISRGERMDYSLQKATELGVRALQPLFTERVEVRLDASRLDKRMAHWQAVIQAACGQCGRATVPALKAPLDLEDWLQAPAPGLRLVLTPEAELSFGGLDPITVPVELVVGPEGGLTEREHERCARSGVLAVSMGPRILRTETAGPAAIAVLQALFGDF